MTLLLPIGDDHLKIVTNNQFATITTFDRPAQFDLLVETPASCAVTP